ncbi:MAG: XdhC family protein [Pseudonocardia sp.]|uniref:XdhC family protein n=1 Tax=unclassified Pseudonocardia TaxID=2619320 RepID=UPI00086ACF58|nr:MULTISPECIES: XdhC family protein [unclassified Pseudonocardia]MBN9107640.1 XdhC family protein [Pseudonocardia sp.]ODV08483.1 MAG: cytochrome oxidase I [Pseudonocardia sp. SCN 73-27]
MTTTEIRAHADRLHRDRVPYVLATVVRAERPTSAKPGDSALVLPDGSIDGFVGGVCAESTVRLEGLRLLASGESELLRVTPSAAEAVAPEGVRVVENPCLSGGTLEIFLEAVIPPVLVRVFGDSPIARAVAQVGTALDLDVQNDVDAVRAVAPDTTAVVVAAHGRDEVPVLRAALDAHVPYIALVASPKRSAAVLAELDVPGDERARIRAPAGLDIGARTPHEIALSIYAEIVARRPRADPSVPAADPVPAPAEALDPVCGMTVAVSPASLTLAHKGVDWYFCGSGCRDAFRDAPQRYLASVGA